MVLKIRGADLESWRYVECARFVVREITLTGPDDPDNPKPDVWEVKEGLYGDRVLVINMWEPHTDRERTLITNTLVYVMENGKTVDALQLGLEHGSPLRTRY